MDDSKEFEMRNREQIKRQGNSKKLNLLSSEWFEESVKTEYTYHFEWLGRPIIQMPQDLLAMQKIIWDTKPDLIIEMGVARGGSIIFYASLLKMLQICEPGQNRHVLGVDVDIREHNKKCILSHPMADIITLFEGSSIDPLTIEYCNKFAAQFEKVLVVLDSNHTHEHVLEELKAFSSLVSVGSYCIVFDTVIDELSNENFLDKPWDNAANPKTAVHEFLSNIEKDNNIKLEFEIDREIQSTLMLTVAPDGYLKRLA